MNIIVTNEKLKFSDLSKRELEKLKDLYVASRINNMSTEELTSFVKISIEDQIKGTVGNEEEREAWKEMKDFFQGDFEGKVNSIELERRLKLVEQRKNEKDKENEDMW